MYAREKFLDRNYVTDVRISNRFWNFFGIIKLRERWQKLKGENCIKVFVPRERLKITNSPPICTREKKKKTELLFGQPDRSRQTVRAMENAYLKANGINNGPA